MDINLYPAADPDQPNRMIVLTDAGLTCTGYDTLGDAAEALAALASDLWRVDEEMAGGLADDESREAVKAHRAADRLTREARLAFGMPDPGSDEEARGMGGAGKPAGPRFNPQPR